MGPPGLGTSPALKFFYSLISAANFFAMFAGLFGIVALAILGVLGTGYLTGYLQRSVTSSAMGEEALPDWPELSDIGSDIISPFFQLLAILAASFLPALAIAFLIPAGQAGSTAVRDWFGLLFGCAYFPMAFLGVAMFDSMVAVSPLLVVPSILRIPLQYLLTILLFGAILWARDQGDAVLANFIPVPVLPKIVSNFVGLYLLTVEMRVLGLLYLSNKNKLGWFSR